MIDMHNYKIAFICHNPFQAKTFRRLVSALPGACFVISEKQKANFDQFVNGMLNDSSVTITIWPTEDFTGLDGLFDIVICNVPFPGIENFKKSRIAMMQYGYAKEAHNYGMWRAFSDLTLVYGRYAAEKIAHLCPVSIVGNPRYDDWFDDDFHAKARSRYSSVLDERKKTVLYAPTWGELSSMSKFIDAVSALSDEYNVLVKMHTLADMSETDIKNRVARLNVVCFGAEENLIEMLAVSDVFVSDYSGAIFDAIFCRKPVVLLTFDISDVSRKHYVDEYSIEYSKRDMLGVVVSETDCLLSIIKIVIDNPDAVVERVEHLRESLFLETPGATTRSVEALNKLAQGCYKRSQKQIYANRQTLELACLKGRLELMQKKLQKERAKRRKFRNAVKKVVRFFCRK